MFKKSLKIPTKRGNWYAELTYRLDSHLEPYVRYYFFRRNETFGKIMGDSVFDSRAVPVWIRKKAAIWMRGLEK